MNLTPEGKVYAYIILASAFFSVFAITFGHFPHLAMSLSFIFFALLAFYVKRQKTAKTKIFLAITLTLAAFLSIRSEGSVTFLNIVSVFYFGTMMTLADDKSLFKSLISVAASPFAFLAKSIFVQNEYHLEYADKVSKMQKREKVMHSATVVFLTIAILSVIVPLLASTNPIFEKWVTGFLELLGITNIKITENLFEWLIRLIFFFGLMILVPKLATQVNKSIEHPRLIDANINMLLPKIAVTAVLILFFITQLQLYFSTTETLASLGYTHSQYAREVFAQLSAVSVVIIALLFNDKGKKRIDQLFTYILLLAGLFLILISFKSVYDYSNAWGFTYKRLYGFTVATWVLGIFAIYFYTYKNSLKTSFFVYSGIILTGIILIAVNLVNFDYLIYHYKKSTIGSGTDYYYLTSLSADSLSYKDQIDNLDKILKSEKPERMPFGNEHPYANFLLYKIEYLQEKYKKPDLRAFNLYEYLAYRQIKDVDITKLRQQIILDNP